MLRQVGPEMLANLDHQLENGNINQPTYDARRVEVMELIRMGKAVEHTRGDKLKLAVEAVVLVVLGCGVVGIVSANAYLITGPVPGLVGLALIGFGISRAVKMLHP